jgi:hypothetical protein
MKNWGLSLKNEDLTDEQCWFHHEKNIFSHEKNNETWWVNMV